MSSANLYERIFLFDDRWIGIIEFMETRRLFLCCKILV